MAALASIAIHPSQFPGNVRRDLLDSLKSRRVNHKFHYDSVRQAQKWLELHQAYSPSRTDPNCGSVYDAAFAGVAQHFLAGAVHLVGLGCGGGQKDTRILSRLQSEGREVYYTPSDVSVAMVLVAREAALAAVPPERCFPLVCDLATTEDLEAVLAAQPAGGAPRLISFFGMIPNFEPEMIMPRIASLISARDRLLFSANLAPGADYTKGIERILPLYDNPLTREWLLLFLRDVGVEPEQGRLDFVIEPNPAGGALKRVAAYYTFGEACEVRIDAERFEFKPGEQLRLFFSYRHTPDSVETLLARHGLKVADRWITDSEEEGVFLCRRAA